MKQDVHRFIDIPSNFASRISDYLNEISDITSDIEDLLSKRLNSTDSFDDDLLKTLQNLDFVRQATADSARLMNSASLSLTEPVDEIIEKLHLEKTASVLKPKVKTEVDVDVEVGNKFPGSGDIQMF
ncbi:MAG: hypothetical protein ABJM43_14735 [Paracoccaceae bacterium]